MKIEIPKPAFEYEEIAGIRDLEADVTESVNAKQGKPHPYRFSQKVCPELRVEILSMQWYPDRQHSGNPTDTGAALRGVPPGATGWYYTIRYINAYESNRQDEFHNRSFDVPEHDLVKLKE